MSDSANQDAGLAAPLQGFGERRFGRVNWRGLWTLYRKEVQRFLKVAFQTVLAPIISTILFLVVFLVALGQDRADINGTPYAVFLGPGLVMMAILNNAFANSSSSLIIAKVQGNLVDYLMPPLSAAELAAGFIAGAATRGLLVGLSTAATIAVVMAFTPTPMGVAHPFWVLYYTLSASILLGALGVLGGIWAQKFDQLAAITNFVITPLAFLSGTFYSITRLPEAFYAVSLWNPFFFLIDGVRFGVTGASPDAPIWRGALVVAVLNVIVVGATYHILKKGYGLKT